jgi:peptidase YpeB-like protein
MRTILFATCAAIIAATAAFDASAGQFAAPTAGPTAVIPVDDNGYYNDGGPTYGQPGTYNSGYDSIPPQSIVENLASSGYRNISDPVLSGRFYQVKAINPNGRKVKLYIDAYTGQIVKVKS